MKNIDLRVLSSVSELNRTRSVSQTAGNLEFSQSAVSMNLAKRRRHFNDPLFVRTSAGMEPTPHASEVTILPTLMCRTGRIAPGVRVDLRRMSEATSKQLESGDADICVGFIPPMGAGYCQQRLFTERFVRADHLRIGATFGLEEFLAETHVAVTTRGSGHAILEKILEAQRLTRRTGLTVPSSGFDRRTVHVSGGLQSPRRAGDAGRPPTELMPMIAAIDFAGN